MLAWRSAFIFGLGNRREIRTCGRLDGDLDILNLECEGNAGLIAIGGGTVEGKGGNWCAKYTLEERARVGEVNLEYLLAILVPGYGPIKVRETETSRRGKGSDVGGV